MKHPHCNRSRGAHLFWCRGFAPIFFILAVALIVVSVGSGIYFATKKSAPVVAVEQPTSSAQRIEAVTATLDAVSPVEEVKPIAPPSSSVKTTAVASVSSYVNCGSSEKSVKCFTDRALSCSPTKGIVTDPSSGLKVERIIDGYKGDNCSYRSNIISGTGKMAVLVGMNVNCMIPKAILSKAMQGGSMTREDMFALCSGTFIDLMRAQQAATQ